MRLLLDLLKVLGLLAASVVILVVLTSLTGVPWLKKGILHGALVLTVVGYSRLHRLRLLSDRLAWSGRARSWCLAGLATGAGITAVVFAGLRLSGETMTVAPARTAAWFLGLLALSTLVAFGEELLFRGLLLKLFAERTTWIAAAVLSSAGFSALHVLNPEYYWFAFGYAFLLGVFLCLVVARTGSLWFPIAFHLAFNFTQSLLGMPDRGGELLYLLSWILSVLLVLRALPAMSPEGRRPTTGGL